MPQQVNLYLPILRRRRQSFAAQTLVQALLILLVGGGVLAAAWYWNLQRASASLAQTVKAQDQELNSLRAALTAAQVGGAPEQLALQRELAVSRSDLARREQWLHALGQGVYEPGFGLAARLRLVAQTIPPQAWLNGLKLDRSTLELTGFTLSPEVLNAWVERLISSPQLTGQNLSAVKVERVPSAAEQVGQAPRWSFQLVSAGSTVATGGTP